MSHQRYLHVKEYYETESLKYDGSRQELIRELGESSVGHVAESYSSVVQSGCKRTPPFYVTSS